MDSHLDSSSGSLKCSLLQTPKKKIRLGLPATQWITVYNAHRPMKQRYHYNVANTRVDQHVEKGNDDGLYISSVACCQELWALIMDAGTGFTAQVRILTPLSDPEIMSSGVLMMLPGFLLTSPGFSFWTLYWLCCPGKAMLSASCR